MWVLKREKPLRASSDGSYIQSYWRNTHKLCSLYHFKKKIAPMCWKKSARVNRFTDINNMRSRSLCKYSFQLCLTQFTRGSVIRQFSTSPRYFAVRCHLQPTSEGLCSEKGDFTNRCTNNVRSCSQRSLPGLGEVNRLQSWFQSQSFFCLLPRHFNSILGRNRRYQLITASFRKE